jgi:hypothetical protein
MLYQFGLLVLVALTATPAYAARIYLDPDTATHSRSDTFYVPVRIDTQGACINVVEVALSYDPTRISVSDVVTGDSILTLWTQTPTIGRDGPRETGRVTFAGGIPGGYCGRVEGDPGLTNVLARLVVTGVPTVGDVGTQDTEHIVIDPSTVAYLNDGSGTAVPLTKLGAELTLIVSSSTPENTWLPDVTSDTIAPEYFDITLVPGPSVGNAKSYIVFNTTDKQSGIDHYEVLETDPERFGFLTWVPREAYYVRAESPYVLRDQKLWSKIMVKAVDKNGNERVAEYIPPMSPLVELARPETLIISLILLGLIVIMGLLIIRRRRSQRTATVQEPYEPTETPNHDA